MVSILLYNLYNTQGEIIMEFFHIGWINNGKQCRYVGQAKIILDFDHVELSAKAGGLRLAISPSDMGFLHFFKRENCSMRLHVFWQMDGEHTYDNPVTSVYVDGHDLRWTAAPFERAMQNIPLDAIQIAFLTLDRDVYILQE